ncbi:MAG TPA: YetF domain-containing protein [Candidatus Sulfotelmatobacter sp.]|nr:YetF domain-containing protein [Candidatus Sulfotelmatobacter sp.]
MLHIFVPEVSVAEKLVRSLAVYVFLLVAFRFTGKRQVGQLTPFDLVVLLIISNVVQNAVIGPDNSLGGGLLGAIVILLLNWAVVEIAFRYKRARRLLEATPTLLIHNGHVLHENLRRERVTLDDLLAALRKNGVVEPSQARYAVLEETGTISVIPRAAGSDPGPPLRPA